MFITFNIFIMCFYLTSYYVFSINKSYQRNRFVRFAWILSFLLIEYSAVGLYQHFSSLLSLICVVYSPKSPFFCVLCSILYCLGLIKYLDTPDCIADLFIDITALID